MEMFVTTMRGIQQIANLGIDMVADGMVPFLVDASDAASDSTTAETDGVIGGCVETAQQIPQQEEKQMAGREFREEELKLVRYKIMFVKRDYEEVLLADKEELVHDNIAESDYVGWKIAEFIQDLDNINVPTKWESKEYPPERRYGKIHKLPEDDKKYLRVYLEVLDSYPRERFRYEEEQIKVLTDIRNELRQKVAIEVRQVSVLEEVRDRIGGPPTSPP
jgi:hypothetical protein